MNDKITRKAEQKTFRYNRISKNSKIFECDEIFHMKPTILSNSISTISSKQPICVQSNVPTSPLKILEAQYLQNFSNFRRHFYHINHQKIKSSPQDYPSIDVTDIRLASINECVQKDFMKRLNENTSYFLDLVYHGTKLDNIKSILRYGFLIPNQAHPSNREAPIIVSANGRAFGSGIYSSYSAVFSLSYVNATNTLLVCAAIPKHDSIGKIERSYANILVLSHESQIIPLFLIDFKYLDTFHTNYSCFKEVTQSKRYKRNEIKEIVIISRKYLRKVLNYINDEVRKNNRYQMRPFEFFN
ncbi:unnamed protein product [Rotaria sp. Silwood1]|nr:unnamed protein product [Rotaria sp. Silwood1]